MIFLHIIVAVALAATTFELARAATFLMTYPSDISFIFGVLLVLLLIPFNYYIIKFYSKYFVRRKK